MVRKGLVGFRGFGIEWRGLNGETRALIRV